MSFKSHLDEAELGWPLVAFLLNPPLKKARRIEESVSDDVANHHSGRDPADSLCSSGHLV
jgi:hypothetical protein